MNRNLTLTLTELITLSDLIQQGRKPLGWIVCYKNGGPTKGRSEPLELSDEYTHLNVFPHAVLLIGCRGTLFTSYDAALTAVINTAKCMTIHNYKWTTMYGPMLILPVFN